MHLHAQMRSRNAALERATAGGTAPRVCASAGFGLTCSIGAAHASPFATIADGFLRDNLMRSFLPAGARSDPVLMPPAQRSHAHAAPRVAASQFDERLHWEGPRGSDAPSVRLVAVAVSSY
jgi:hypothetical protein